MRPILVCLFLLAGCRAATSSPSTLTSEITVSPAVVAAGDTVRLLVATTNHGATPVEAGAGCGEGLDFEITLPDGSRHYPMRDLVSTCQYRDSNRLEPGETDTVRFSWATPRQPGSYRVRGGVRQQTGLGGPSRAESVELR